MRVSKGAVKRATQKAIDRMLGVYNHLDYQTQANKLEAYFKELYQRETKGLSEPEKLAKVASNFRKMQGEAVSRLTVRVDKALNGTSKYNGKGELR